MQLQASIQLCRKPLFGKLTKENEKLGFMKEVLKQAEELRE